MRARRALVGKRFSFNFQTVETPEKPWEPYPTRDNTLATNSAISPGSAGATST